MARELTEGVAAHGHRVSVATTSLVDIRRGRTARSRDEVVGGVPVRYLATPARYRWMGITPSLPSWLAKIRRPDVVHLFGYRDFVTTTVSAWAAWRRIPTVFEPLGMFEPRLRKVRLKRVFDTTVARHVAQLAAVVVATSDHERTGLAAAGVAPFKIDVRGNGFPRPEETVPSGTLRPLLGLRDEPLVLYVGRIARGKGIELLVDALRRLPAAHLALVGPDDGHGVSDIVRAAERDPATASRVHRLEPGRRPLDLYGDADVFALPSEGESFGMAAAEAAAAGTPVVVTDRCGVSEFLDGGALVVPYDGEAVTAALGEVLRDADLRDRLSRAAVEAARRNSWEAVVDRQVDLYRLAIERRDAP